MRGRCARDKLKTKNHEDAHPRDPLLDPGRHRCRLRSAGVLQQPHPPGDPGRLLESDRNRQRRRAGRECRSRRIAHRRPLAVNQWRPRRARRQSALLQSRRRSRACRRRARPLRRRARATGALARRGVAARRQPGHHRAVELSGLPARSLDARPRRDHSRASPGGSRRPRVVAHARLLGERTSPLRFCRYGRAAGAAAGGGARGDLSDRRFLPGRLLRRLHQFRDDVPAVAHGRPASGHALHHRHRAAADFSSRRRKSPCGG